MLGKVGNDRKAAEPLQLQRYACFQAFKKIPRRSLQNHCSAIELRQPARLLRKDD
jgi:hypothetical protein